MKKSAIVITLVFIIPGAVFAQTPIDSSLIGPYSRVLEIAAMRLSYLYAKPITYEDAIQVWNGDNEQTSYGDGRVRIIPKKQTFQLPVESSPDKTPVLDEKLLSKILDSYHVQTNGPIYEVITSSWGLHIVPKMVRDINGKYVNAIRLMDTRITVPMAKRTPLDHFRAILDAINMSSSSSIKIDDYYPNLNGYFVSGLPRGEWKASDKERISFSWGVSDTIARDALIDLFEYSSTTLRWAFLCDAFESNCTLNIEPLVADEIGHNGEKQRKTVFYDRKNPHPFRKDNDPNGK
jgi:hypothetical protein